MALGKMADARLEPTKPARLAARPLGEDDQDGAGAKRSGATSERIALARVQRAAQGDDPEEPTRHPGVDPVRQEIIARRDRAENRQQGYREHGKQGWCVEMAVMVGDNDGRPDAGQPLSMVDCQAEQAKEQRPDDDRMESHKQKGRHFQLNGQR